MTSLLGLQQRAAHAFLARPPRARSIFNVPNLSSLSPFASSSDPPQESYHERKILPYTREQLYEIVADVDSYHCFVPYCTASRVLKPPPPEEFVTSRAGVQKKEAELTVGFLGFKESYVSQVTCTPYDSVEAIASSATPLFKTLTTTWRFQPADRASPHPSQNAAPPRDIDAKGSPSVPDIDRPTLLSIDLVYAFSNPLHAGISSAFFQQISQMMVAAFEERCLQVYGPGAK